MTPYRTGLLTKSLLLCAAAFAAASVVLPSSARSLADRPAAEPRQKADAKSAVPLLTKDDVNLIKVFEVHLDTNPPPRITIPKKRLEEFLDEYKTDERVQRARANQKAWLQQEGHVHLSLMFKVRARQYYGDVSIRSRIDSLHKWGTIHRRYLLGYFYKHFGAGDVSGLKLHPIARRNLEQIQYTNLYILTQVSINGQRMIDRNDPEDSLLLQWGLPASEAKYPSPKSKKDGWSPRFKSTKDREYQEILKWIESLHRFNQDSDYGIKYKMPKTGSKKSDSTNSSKGDTP